MGTWGHGDGTRKLPRKPSRKAESGLSPSSIRSFWPHGPMLAAAPRAPPGEGVPDPLTLVKFYTETFSMAPPPFF